LTHLSRTSRKSRKNIQAKAWAGYAIANALHLPAKTKDEKNRIKALIEEWLREGHLVHGYTDAERADALPRSSKGKRLLYRQLTKLMTLKQKARAFLRWRKRKATKDG
jgi:hypothetical protein